MNNKMKGSALVAAIGMVMSLSVAAPASAATTAPTGVSIFPGTTGATVELDLTTDAAHLVYRLYTNGGNKPDAVVHTVPNTTFGIGANETLHADHYTFYVTPAAGEETQIRINLGACSDNACTAGSIQWENGNKSYSFNSSAPSTTPVITANADTAADGAVNLTLISASTAATSYEYTTDSGASWRAAPAASGNVISIVDESDGTALVDGQVYAEIKLRGKNSSGYSQPSSKVSATPYSKPSAPVLLGANTVTYGDGTLTVGVDTVAAPNGQALSGYVWKDGGTATGRATIAACAAGSDVQCLTAHGLTNNASYTGISFAGVNGHGAGPYSDETISGIPSVHCAAVAAPSIKFTAKKAALSASAKRSLNTYAVRLNASDCSTVSLQAHRISTKKAKTNAARIRLGNARNAAVAAYLRARGVSKPITASVVTARDGSTVRAFNSTWSVSYVLQGGTAGATAGSSSYASGRTIGLPSDPTRTGYDFVGWFDAASAGANVDLDANGLYTPASPYGNVTLYAHWVAQTWAVTYDINGGATQPADDTYDSDGSFTLAADPTLLGYDFLGWFTAATGGTKVGNAGQVVTPTSPYGDKTLYAQWAATPWTVTYDTGTDSVAVADGTYDSDGSFTLPATPVRAGYTFVEWTWDAAFVARNDTAGVDAATAGDPGDVIIPASPWGDVTVTASWTANTYAVTYDWGTSANTSGVDPLLTDSEYVTGETVSPLEVGATNSGFTFGGWSVVGTDDDGNDWTDTTAYNDTSYKAEYPFGVLALTAIWNPNRAYAYANLPGSNLPSGSYSFTWSITNSPVGGLGAVTVALGNSPKCTITGGATPGVADHGTVSFSVDTTQRGSKNCTFTFTTAATGGWASPTNNSQTITVQ